eukprot:CAMPEP_0201606168 /NCGR_PEP_ID=MMETSP0492-20130828/5718_1 /ASSEMBLY_ACC=CAM_ASM_000837 /TAXON_ID=420259 /ORGANISM="Thalassiosira gravida, Strain GMp14c1" /LENGTH=91 /DNA_ID=CAMNT_0048070527 /DNA_START=875 /DNA_END=1150 /DNA_ORIENTATION=+
MSLPHDFRRPVFVDDEEHAFFQLRDFCVDFDLGMPVSAGFGNIDRLEFPVSEYSACPIAIGSFQERSVVLLEQRRRMNGLLFRSMNDHLMR